MIPTRRLALLAAIGLLPAGVVALARLLQGPTDGLLAPLIAFGSWWAFREVMGPGAAAGG